MLIDNKNSSNSTVLLFNILILVKASIAHVLSLDLCNNLPETQVEENQK